MRVSFAVLYRKRSSKGCRQHARNVSDKLGAFLQRSLLVRRGKRVAHTEQNDMSGEGHILMGQPFGRWFLDGQSLSEDRTRKALEFICEAALLCFLFAEKTF